MQEISRWARITVIDLDGCNIEDEGAGRLAAALGQWPSLAHPNAISRIANSGDASPSAEEGMRGMADSVPICQHDRIRRQCKECLVRLGSSIWEHNQQRSQL